MSVSPQAPVTVIIVNFNGGEHLLRCLACLADQETPAERIVLIDNCSTDGSAAAAREWVARDGRLTARLEQIDSAVNTGFAAANNRAVEACTTEFVALLNPDAFPDRGWLTALLAAARQHPEAASFGSWQRLDGRPGLLDGVGDVYHISGVAWRDGHEKPHGDCYEPDGEIFSACAAAALYRRQTFLDVGGFDEDFFCYFEDVDLGFRLRLAGHAARAVAAAGVSHMGFASAGGRRSTFAVYHGHRNLVWCFAKNMPFPLVLLLLPGHIALLFYDLVLFMLRGCGAAVVTAKWHALVGLPKFLGKRRAVQAIRRATCLEIWRIMDHRCWPKRRRTRATEAD
jgi:GT2 family glycosyltransferase